MSVAIRVENLAKRYVLGQLGRSTFWSDWRRKLTGGAEPEDGPGVFWALRDVSFDVRTGEVLAVIGKNGAGKSTLLKILSSITSPTRGSIKLRGRVASLLEVGTGFHPELTGRENVFLNGAILGMRHREVQKKFDEIVEFSGVEQFIDTPLKRYSSGMRVRLAFAVAASLEPEILVIDEVLAVGDAAFQRKCLGKIGEVAGAGRTVLFVSHHAAAIEALCTRGIVLNGGKVCFDGTQTEALRHYAEMSAVSGTSVRERSDRQGSGALRVVEFEMRNESGKVTQTLNSGETVEFWLHFENPNGAQFPGLNARLNVRTQLGVPVFTQSNQLVGQPFGALPERGAFVCQVPRVPLPGGTYRVSFQVSKTYRQAEMIDAVEDAMEVQVEGGDYFGTGMVPAQISGMALVPAQWRLASTP